MKVSIFVRGVPSSFWVLFLILPLNHVTLVNWVTCSLVFSMQMYVFHLSQYYLKSQWGQSNCGLHTKFMVWQGFSELKNGICWVGNAGLAAVSLATWSYTGAAWLDCFSNVERPLWKPYFKGDALLTLPYTRLHRRQGFVAAPPFPDGISKTKPPSNNPPLQACQISEESEVFWKGHACSCFILLRWAPKTPPALLSARRRCLWPHQSQDTASQALQSSSHNAALALSLSEEQLPSLQGSQLHHATSEKWDKSQKICLSQALNKISDLCNTCKALTSGTSSHQASVNQQCTSPRGLQRC